MSYMLKNSAGDRDGMWTITFVSWVVVTIVFLISLFSGEFQLGENIHFTISPPDNMIFTTYLGIVTTGYVIRRNKREDKNDT